MSCIYVIGEGRRFQHEPTKGSWISCAVFCRTERDQWYLPRAELGHAAFFPDGTWCHTDEYGRDYYCQKSLCLPDQHKYEDAVRAAADAANFLHHNFFDDDQVAIEA
jgi:hypothetical protein